MTDDQERDDESFESLITTEVEFLEAVYINELVLERNEHGKPVRVSLQLHPATGEDTDQQYVCLNLAFVLPADYPHILPEININNPRGLAESHVQSIRDTLDGMAKEREGSSMLYDLIEYTKESLNEVNIPHGQCVICLEQFCESDVFKKTECYHYFHSYCLLRYVRHCLKVIEEEQMQALRHKSIAERQVVCPVCREPLTYDLEALGTHPEPTGEKDSFKPDSALREQQRKMAEMFENQKLKGGIIDVEAERNKFYIALRQKTELAETDTSEGASDIASTSENSVLKVEEASSKQGHDSRYRGKRFQYGKERGHEKYRRRGMGRGFRKQPEHHNGKNHGKDSSHPESNYVHSDKPIKQSKERFRQHNNDDLLLNGEAGFVNRKPGDHRQLQRMDEYRVSGKNAEDRAFLLDDKVRKFENIEKKTNHQDEGVRNSSRVDVKKQNTTEDIMLNKVKNKPGHAHLSVERSHFNCDVKGLVTTEKSDPILDDLSHKSDDFDSRSESYKASDMGFSGRRTPVQADQNRHRISYGKPPRKDRNIRGNRQHKPGSNWNAFSSEDRHIQSNSEARFRNPERKGLLNLSKDREGSDDRIVKSAGTGENNFRMEAFNRSRRQGTDCLQAENWDTVKDDSMVDDNKSKKERQAIENESKKQNISRSRVKNKSGRYSEKNQMRKHAEKIDSKSLHKNETYTFSGQKPGEVEKTSSYPRKSSQRHGPLSQDDDFEDWSVESCRDRNENKGTVGHKLRENQLTDNSEFQLDRTNKGNGNLTDSKNRSTVEDNYTENWSMISSSDSRGKSCVERKSKHLKDTVKQKKLPRENFKTYSENNCDCKFELENCFDGSVDSFEKGKLKLSEMPGQWDEKVHGRDYNAGANKVSERNCGRIPPGFHAVGPPPGFQLQTVGNKESPVLDLFR